MFSLLLSPDTHPKFSTVKKYESFSRAIRFHLGKDITIPSSKAQKSHVKLITYMNNDNVFDLLIDAVFSMIPQIGELGPKSQDLVIFFCLGEVETLPKSHLRSLQIRGDFFVAR